MQVQKFENYSISKIVDKNSRYFKYKALKIVTVDCKIIELQSILIDEMVLTEIKS